MNTYITDNWHLRHSQWTFTSSTTDTYIIDTEHWHHNQTHPPQWTLISSTTDTSLTLNTDTIMKHIIHNKHLHHPQLILTSSTLNSDTIMMIMKHLHHPQWSLGAQHMSGSLAQMSYLPLLVATCTHTHTHTNTHTDAHSHGQSHTHKPICMCIRLNVLTSTDMDEIMNAWEIFRYGWDYECQRNIFRYANPMIMMTVNCQLYGDDSKLPTAWWWQ